MAKVVIPMVVAALLAGCVRYQPKPISAPQSASAFEVRSLSSKGLRQFLETKLHQPSGNWPRASWDFTNLTFAAFFFHPDLDVARARWATVQAGTKTAGERPNPTVSVTPGRNTSTLIPSPWLVTATLDIPVETAGKRGYRMAQASQLADAARMNLASAAWQVRSRLRRSLLEFEAARGTEERLKEQQEVQARLVRQLEAQLREGAVSVFEVTQARIGFDTLQLALHDAIRQKGDAFAHLGAAVGVPAAVLEGVDISFVGLDVFPSDLPSAEARRQALLNRSDILGALAEYAASDTALRLQIAKQYPDVHLNPGYEFDQGDNKWSLGLAITLPILNQNRGAIAEAQARRDEAATGFVALQAGAINESGRALVAYQASLGKVATAEALLLKSKKQLLTTKGLLEAGEVSGLSLLTAQVEASTAALAHLNALVQAQLSLGQLEDALQSPVGLSESLWLSSPRPMSTTTNTKHE